MNPTYHERVARVMAASISVGTFAPYEVILQFLLNKWPTEEEMRKVVAEMEERARKVGAPVGWRFVQDDPEQYN